MYIIYIDMIYMYIHFTLSSEDKNPDFFTSPYCTKYFVVPRKTPGKAWVINDVSYPKHKHEFFFQIFWNGN